MTVAEWKALSLGPVAGKRERNDVQKRLSTWNTSVLFTLTLNLRKIKEYFYISIKHAVYFLLAGLFSKCSLGKHLFLIIFQNFFLCYLFLVCLVSQVFIQESGFILSNLVGQIVYNSHYAYRNRQKYHICSPQTNRDTLNNLALNCSPPSLTDTLLMRKCWHT